MRNLLAVIDKEMKIYFASPVAYGVLTVFLLVSGYFFYNILTVFIQRSMMMAVQAQQFGGGAPAMDVPALVERNFFGIVSTIILFMVPMITMATFADERRRATIELLLTSPLTHFQLILGKFLAAMGFFSWSCCCRPWSTMPSFISTVLPRWLWNRFLSGYLGLLLLGAAPDLPGHLYLDPYRKSDGRRQRYLWRPPDPLGDRPLGPRLPDPWCRRSSVTFPFSTTSTTSPREWSTARAWSST